MRNGTAGIILNIIMVILLCSLTIGMIKGHQRTDRIFAEVTND